MEIYEWIYIAVCVLLAGVFIVARTIKGGYLGLMLKVLASMGFVVSAILGLCYTEAVGMAKLSIALIAIGMALGMIGDILLDLKVIYDNDAWYLNTGMLSFGLGHLCYFTALTLFAIAEDSAILVPMLVALGISIALTIAITISSKTMLKLDYGKYNVQTIAYTFVLSYMVVYSLLLALYLWYFWIAFAGLAIFFASDIVLSFQYFGGKIESKPLIAINHALYYVAQIVLLAFILII